MFGKTQVIQKHTIMKIQWLQVFISILFEMDKIARFARLSTLITWQGDILAHLFKVRN